MESWWELGEWSGHSGNTLEVWRLTCPFCEEEGNFGLAYHAEKKKASSTKKLNFDLYQCRNCMAYVHSLLVRCGALHRAFHLRSEFHDSLRQSNTDKQLCRWTG